MKRNVIMPLAMLLAASAASAQSALDIYSISQNDLRGTARFMSMAGAFGALGGDLSTLNQNPGGIGVYRSSEVGATLDIDFQSSTSTPATGGAMSKYDQTRVACNNFGYVGSLYTGSDVLPYFNWGASYSRQVSFDRVVQGGMGTLGGSLTNYVAGYTSAEGWMPDELSQFNSSANPYQDTYAPWMSILFFNNYLINPSGAATNYQGLYNGTAGTGDYWTREQGYLDEYSINFGGNFSNTVFWGIGFGITDLSYTQSTYYGENFSSATVPNSAGNGITTGSAGWGLSSWKHIYGNGFNLKLGVIVKPVNELRIGLAVHTPTWYSVTQEGYASVGYNLSTGYSSEYVKDGWVLSTNEGINDMFNWKPRTPWRLIASAAGVVGGRFIISADYEFRAYHNMTIADFNGNNGNGNPNSTFTDVNNDVRDYYCNSNALRLGAEYRITPQLSARAGFGFESSPVTAQMSNNQLTVYTSGPDDTETTPSYTTDNTTRYLTCGLGYRYKAFYVDLAYVNRHRSSTFHAFTPLTSDNIATGAAQAHQTHNDNHLVLSIGFKF